MKFTPSHDTLQGIAFDVFGTVVDWFGGVVAAGKKISDHVDWKAFAMDWLTGYRSRVELVRTGKRPWDGLDTLLNESFAELVVKHAIADMDTEVLTTLRTVWHRLSPWPDVLPALHSLREKYRIAALSNANILLLVDMAKSAALPWDCIICAEMPRKYKPEAEVYRMTGAALGPKPEQVLYVAAHKWDLKAGQLHGLRGAFIPRPDELGAGGPPSEENPGPEPTIDFYAENFIDLAAQLGAPVRARVMLEMAGIEIGTKPFAHKSYRATFEAEVEQEPTPKPLPVTDLNLEGPYYRPGAPHRVDLSGEDEPGRRLYIDGTVSDESGRRLRGVTLDIWQATNSGHYDIDGSGAPETSDFTLRGQLLTNEKGEYEIRTVWPGSYNIGGGLWRASHIHVKLRAPNFQELTTQLYFKGDAYNPQDIGYDNNLEIVPELQDQVYYARFDFVIASLP